MGKKNLGPLLLLAVERNDGDKVHDILATQIRSADKIRQLCTSAIARPPSETLDVPLFLAAAIDDPAIVTYMVETHGVNVNFVHRTGDPEAPCGGRVKVRTALMMAVRRGCHVTVAALLAMGADATVVDHKRRSLLHHAVRRADYAMAKLLLTQSGGAVRVDVTDAADNTPLHVAAIFGHVQLARLLLREDSGIGCLNRPAQHGALPIHMAAAQGHVGILSLFCTEGGNVEMAAPCYDGRHKAALHVAAEHGHFEAVAVLVERHGATVNLHDSEGETPLHCCVLHQRDPLGMRFPDDFTRTARVLLMAGAEVNSLNKRGETALHLSARSEAHDVLNLLLQAGADPLLEDNDRNKAIDLVSTRDVLVLQTLRAAMAERERQVGEALEIRARGFSTATASVTSLGSRHAVNTSREAERMRVVDDQTLRADIYAEDGYLQPLGSRLNISQDPTAQVVNEVTQKLTKDMAQQNSDDNQLNKKDILLTKSPRKRRSRENLLRLRASKQNGNNSDTSEEQVNTSERVTKPQDPSAIRHELEAHPTAVERERSSSENSSLWNVTPHGSTSKAPASSPVNPAKTAPGSVTVDRRGLPVINIQAAGANRSSEALAHAFSDSDGEGTSIVDDESFVTMSENENDYPKPRNLQEPLAALANASGAPLKNWLVQQSDLVKELKQHQGKPAGPIAHSTPPAHRVTTRPDRRDLVSDAVTESDGSQSPEPPNLPPRKDLAPERPPRIAAASDHHKPLPAIRPNKVLNKSADSIKDITVQMSDGAVPSQTIITVVNQPGKRSPNEPLLIKDNVDSSKINYEKLRSDTSKGKESEINKSDIYANRRKPPEPPQGSSSTINLEHSGTNASNASQQLHRELPQQHVPASDSSFCSEAVYAEIESDKQGTAGEYSSDEDDDDEEVPNSGHQVAILYDTRDEEEEASDNLVMVLYHQIVTVPKIVEGVPQHMTTRGVDLPRVAAQSETLPIKSVVNEASSLQKNRQIARSNDRLALEDKGFNQVAQIAESGEMYEQIPHDSRDEDQQQKRRVTYGAEEIIPNNTARAKDADNRSVVYNGNGRVCISVVGGNAEGVFVHRIVPGSDAEQRGVMEGDEILAINENNVKGQTCEEVTLLLMSLKQQVSLLVRQRRERYEHVLDSGGGDAFFVRARFTHDASGRDGELSVHDGDIFSVRETLPGGQMGSWRAVRLTTIASTAGNDEQEGLIPNRPRAEQIVLTQRLDSQKTQRDMNSGGFLRRSFKRSKSLDRLNKSSRKDSATKSPLSPGDQHNIAYERIEQQSVTFNRPVVILGLFADAVCDRLVQDSPGIFALPAGELEPASNKRGSPIVDTRLIRKVVAAKKHCLMIISPSAIEHLETTDLHPIVMYLSPSNAATLKAVRASLAPNFGGRINHMLKESATFERAYGKLFTATVNYTTDYSWLSLLKDTINRIQNQPLWQTIPNQEHGNAFVFPVPGEPTDTRLRLNRSSDDILGETNWSSNGTNRSRYESETAAANTGRSRPTTRAQHGHTQPPTMIQQRQEYVQSGDMSLGKPKSILKKNSLDRNGNERYNGEAGSSSSSSSSLQQNSSRAPGSTADRAGAFQRAGQVQANAQPRQTGRQGVRPKRGDPVASYETPL